MAQPAIVRPDGGFTFPLAGELNATDKTVAALAEEIRARLIRFIPEALVSVDVAELRGARIYIIGQVQMPGEFTMLSALDVHSGVEHGGRRDRVRVTGRHPYSPPRRARADEPFRSITTSVIRGRDLEENITLQDGDVIIVP